MPTVTLFESAKLSENQMVIGLIQDVITVNTMYASLPFMDIDGNALAYNREATLAPVATVGVGDSDGSIGAGASGTNSVERAAAKNAATFVQVTTALTTIMGDAEVNGLIQATRSGKTNQTAIQIGSKAKSAGRKYQDMLVNGDGTNFTFPGMISLCAPGQIVAATGGNGDALSFETMDETCDLVTDQDGQVDFIAMHARTIRSFKSLLRGLGGATITEVVELPLGNKMVKVLTYDGKPIFRNDYIPTDQTTGAVSTTTSFFAGTFDDGSQTHGIVGLTASEQSGLHVEDVGASETKDERIWRVKWYTSLALFSEKGLAMATGITN